MNEPIKQSRRPRWFQFSLRTLLVLMLVVAAYFAGFSTARKIDEKAIRDASDRAAEQLDLARQNALLAEEGMATANALADEAMFRAAMQSTATVPSQAEVPSQAPSSK